MLHGLNKSKPTFTGGKSKNQAPAHHLAQAAHPQVPTKSSPGGMVAIMP